MWVGILLFPLAGMLFIVLAIIMKMPGLQQQPGLGVAMIVSCSFFSYIIWSGSSDVRLAFRKRMRISRRAMGDLVAIEQMIHQKTPYIFYLRDFNSGQRAHTISDVKMPSFVGGYTTVKKEGSLRMQEVTAFLETYAPIVMLYNRRDKTYNYKGRVLLCSDEQWYPNFTTLAHHAAIIVLDYAAGFEHSPAIRQEIQYVLEHRPPIIVVGTKKELKKMEQLGIQPDPDSTVLVHKLHHDQGGFLVKKSYAEKIFIPDSIQQKLTSWTGKS